MSNAEARTVVSDAVSLSASHPHAPAVDVLELTLRGRRGQVLDFGDPGAPLGSLAAPGAPFGQLIAAAYDLAMTPNEWRLFTGPGAHPKLRMACLMAWRSDVVSKMVLQHGVTVVGLPEP
ncbi:hypothetical protein [Rubrivivax albus]|uniref:Uncharacterized protein n=1 Tax=Rubrivivax albus TaxID=2499835 RepID=A0A437K0S3_9BURK|nr:hypothetical protein [Rubrivivax albus]RVT53977.1 hypothetical protein ENE75_03615 [Rubrivivax albus]